jgi:hypothetical protein
MTNHLGLDLDLVELLAAVYADNAANHLGDDNHITEVGLDKRGLLVRGSGGLCVAELLDEAHGLALETAVHAAADARVHDIAQLLRGQVKEPAEL